MLRATDHTENCVYKVCARNRSSKGSDIGIITAVATARDCFGYISYLCIASTALLGLQNPEGLRDALLKRAN